MIDIINNIYFRKIVSYYGSQTKVAMLICVSKQTVSQWFNDRTRIPVIYALKFEYLTKGKFKHIKFLDKRTQCYLKKNLNHVKH